MPGNRAAQGWRRVRWTGCAGPGGFCALLLQPDPPHCFAEPGGPDRAGGEHPLSLAFRAGLIDARAENLLSTGEVIARAIAATGTTENNGLTIDPDRLLDLKPGETFGPSDEALVRSRFPDQSRTHRPGAARADLADQDPRPDLRSRRRADPRQPQPIGRGDVMRFELAPPSTARRESSSARRSPSAPGSIVATCRSIAN